MKKTINNGAYTATGFTGKSEEQIQEFLESMKESDTIVIEEEDNIITIVFKNGDMVHYLPEEYTDYRYDGKYFIVIRDKQWIGFYNLDCVEYIEVGR